ncbi:MAG: response regulator, partial [Terriglobia bacterium]
EQGIEVVAVGNGEAAVRKISDIRPDLVLADVFMPVRNGYEVCQYVKTDSSLAHIPVILLVGAFDPLDEQEAQRVGADGVLKKPFVPPDPLISMVKSALARAGVAIGGAPAPPRREEPVRVAEMLTPRTAPTPAPPAFASASSYGTVREMPAESEPAHEEMPGLPAPVKIDAGSQPLAFGSMLEPTEEEQEDELGCATTARPELERDWKSGKDEEEEVEEEEETENQNASWRRDAGNEAMDEVEAGGGQIKDWRETAFADAPARKMKNDSWAPQKETSVMEEAAEAEHSVSAMVKDAPIEETRSAAAEVAPFTQDAWASTLSQKTSVEAATLEKPVQAPEIQEERMVTVVEPEAPLNSPVVAQQTTEPQKREAESPWFSAVSSSWDAEAQKASQLASTWDAPGASETAAESGAVSEAVAPAEKHEEAAKEESVGSEVTWAQSQSQEVKVIEVALTAATVETIREEVHEVAETAAPAEASAVESASKAAEPSMEDLVAKVLAKMNPDMLQAVTRDILKNVVESMVKEELNAKK